LIVANSFRSAREHCIAHSRTHPSAQGLRISAN
jgi:hypothetical protein